MRVLGGGVSNRTVLVRLTSGEAWVLKQALAKLRVEVDWFSDPQRVHREALAMQWLVRLAPAGSITDLVFEDQARHLLAMRAVPSPHVNWKTLLLEGNLRSSHITSFADILRAVHAGALARQQELAPLFGDRSYFESLRLEPYYTYTASQVPQAAQFLESLIEETRNSAQTLVHGDFSPKNVLVTGDRLVLLDHEVAHWGDPAFDVGFACTHLLSKAHFLAKHRQDFAKAACLFWARYHEDCGKLFVGLESRSVRHTLACLLARVAGRSPLEYLPESHRAAQRRAAVALLQQPPLRMTDLVEQFIGHLA
jgi:5-methylthioribose kinase